jgi:NADPH-dependent curcumin reductase
MEIEASVSDTILQNRRYRLRSRPDGRIDRRNFDLVREPIPEPADGQALVRIIYLSLDPTNRVWMSERDQYMPPVAIGDVMRGIALGIIVRSRSPMFAEGTFVTGLLGWQDYCLVGKNATPAAHIATHPDVPLSASLGICGITGQTAYFGLLDIGNPQKRETVMVSAAAGGVGSAVGQIASIKGCNVVGIAGGAEKCTYLVNELGFDAAIDYRAADFRQQLAKATPNGVDVNFENVGGEIMEAVMSRMNVGSRMVLCGLISGYNDDGPMRADFSPILMRRISVRGFLISDYRARFNEATRQLAQWTRDGLLRSVETIVDGLDEAPDALNKLFDGRNYGKLLVRVSPD